MESTCSLAITGWQEAVLHAGRSDFEGRWARLGSAGAGLQRLFAGWQEPLVVEAAQPWPRQLGSSVLPWS